MVNYDDLIGEMEARGAAPTAVSPPKVNYDDLLNELEARSTAPTAGDYGKGFASAGLSAIGSIPQMAGEIGAFGLNKITGTENYQGFNPLESTAKKITDSMTPSGKAAMADVPKGDVLSPSTWELPDTKAGTAMMGVRGLGALATWIIPAGAALNAARLAKAGNIAGATAAAKVAVGAGAVTGGLSTGGDAAGEARQNVATALDAMPHAQRMAEVPTYAESFNKTGNEAEAKQSVVNHAAILSGSIAGTIGAVEGGVGGGLLGRFGLGKALPGIGAIASTPARIVAGGVAGAVIEGAQEGIEKTGSNVGENIAMGRDLTDDATRNTFGEVIGGALIGGPIGSVGGGVSLLPGANPAPTPAEELALKNAKVGTPLPVAAKSITTNDIVKKDGSPFATKKLAAVAIKSKKLKDVEPVNVGVNQWVLRKPEPVAPTILPTPGNSPAALSENVNVPTPIRDVSQPSGAIAPSTAIAVEPRSAGTAGFVQDAAVTTAAAPLQSNGVGVPGADQAANAEPSLAQPQPFTDKDAEVIIFAAADSVKTLRKFDVGRVLDETPAIHKTAMAEYLRKNRRDLADEVDDVMEEASQIAPQPVAKPITQGPLITSKTEPIKQPAPALTGEKIYSSKGVERAAQADSLAREEAKSQQYDDLAEAAKPIEEPAHALTTAQAEVIAEPEPIHEEDGKIEEAAPDVIRESIAKSASETPRNIREAREWLVGKIDTATESSPPRSQRVKMRNFAGYGDVEYTKEGLEAAADKTSKRGVIMALDAATHDAPSLADVFGFVTFDVPGDGKFKVLNTKESLARFKANALKSPGFKNRAAFNPLAKGSAQPVLAAGDATGGGETQSQAPDASSATDQQPSAEVAPIEVAPPAPTKQEALKAKMRRTPAQKKTDVQKIVAPTEKGGKVIPPLIPRSQLGGEKTLHNFSIRFSDGRVQHSSGLHSKNSAINKARTWFGQDNVAEVRVHGQASRETVEHLGAPLTGASTSQTETVTPLAEGQGPQSKDAVEAEAAIQQDDVAVGDTVYFTDVRDPSKRSPGNFRGFNGDQVVVVYEGGKQMSLPRGRVFKSDVQSAPSKQDALKAISQSRTSVGKPAESSQGKAGLSEKEEARYQELLEYDEAGAINSHGEDQFGEKSETVKSAWKEYQSLKKRRENKAAKTDSGASTAMFSRKPTSPLANLSQDAIDATIQRLRKRLKLSADFQILTYESKSALPAWILKQATEEGSENQVHAVYDGNAIHVITTKFETAAELEEAILHEVAGHYGFQSLFGADYRRSLLRFHMKVGGEASIKAMADKAGIDMSPYFDTIKALTKEGKVTPEQRAIYLADELLASMQGAKAHKSLPQRIVQALQELIGAFRVMLRNAGFDNLARNDDADVAHLLRKMMQAASGDPVQADKAVPAFMRKGQTETGGSGSRASWDAPEPSRFDTFLYEMQNRHIDTKRVVEAIGDVAEIPDAFDPTLHEELYYKRSSKRVEDFNAKELKPMLRDMKMRGVTVEEMFGDQGYLHARHAKEANAHIAAINPNEPGLQDGGSGMTDQQAEELMAELTPEKRRAYESIAKRADTIIEGTRNTLLQYGIEDQGTIDSWTSAYQHHVPLFREDMGDGPGKGQGFSVRGPSSKKRTGSHKAIENILGNIAQQRERAIVRGEKNRVAGALYGLALTNPNANFWTADKVPTRRIVDPRTGEVVKRVDPMHKSKPNVVTARILNQATGRVEEHSVEFNARDSRALRMAEAIKNMDMDSLGHVLSLSGMITRYIAKVNTQYNPIFGLMNFTRDVQGAMLNLSTTPLAGHRGEVLKNTFSAIKNIYKDIREHRKGRTPSSKWAADWEEMQLEGGTTGFSELFKDSNDRMKAVEREIAAISEGKAKAAGRAIFDWLSDYNETMENAVRVAAYRAAIGHGMTKPRAASLAKNLTVNFNRKGRIATQAGSLYAFFNASAQGTARLAETIKGPAGTKIIMGGVLLGVIQALGLAAAGFDDDDPPDFVRERNLVLPLFPFTGDKKYLTTPIPLGLHVIPNVGRVFTEMALYGHPGDRMMELAGVIADAFNPIGNAGLSLQTIAPTAIDPFAALSENKDFTGKPISREDFSKLAPTPGFTRGKEATTWLARWASETINWATGGTDYKPGVFSPTPESIEYLFGQATGGVGREAGKVIASVESLGSPDALPSYKIPLVGRLYGDADQPAGQAGKFYDTLRKLNEHEAEIKGRKQHGEDVQGYLADHPEAKLFGMGNDAQQEVQKLQAKKRLMQKAGASDDRIKAVSDKITAIMKNLNDRVKRAEYGEAKTAATR